MKYNKIFAIKLEYLVYSTYRERKGGTHKKCAISSNNVFFFRGSAVLLVLWQRMVRVVHYLFLACNSFECFEIGSEVARKEKTAWINIHSKA